MNEPQGALASHGVPLSDAGYEVIHVGHAKKGPSYDGWQKIKTTPQIVRQWAANGKANCNVGVRTKFTPAVDIDITDEEFSDELNAWCQKNLGPAPTRVGRAPKQLLVYATEKPFTKRVLSFLRPGEDPKTKKDTQKIEILGEGQQFIAYGIHEDTKKPYVWTSEQQLTDLQTWELSLITPSDIERLFNHAESMAKARGWKVTKRSGHQIEPEKSDDIANYQFGTDFSDEQLRGFLQVLDPDNGYDYWLQVGQALHHHYEGDPQGVELWDEWSQRSINYDANELQVKWKSFHDDRSGKVITAKTLAHWAQEENKKLAENAYAEALELIAARESVVGLTDGTLYHALAKMITAPHQVNLLAAVIKDRAKALGTSVGINDIRKGLNKFLRKLEGKKEIPKWCQDFVYVTLDDKFYDMKKHRSISDRGFNAKFNRVISQGGDETLTATRFALDMLWLPTADSYTYLPNSPAIVERHGLTLVNIYNRTGVPTVPVITTTEEDEAVELVKNHFAMMFPNERERDILISYFAFTVQELESRVRWAPLIYGGEGVGKTFYQELMRAILGPSNVMPVNSRQLAQTFTGWAEGRKMVVFEEIRLSGQNRYEILDALKPYITNDTVDVRLMFTDSYTVENVTNYLMFTNHADALPLALGDRRYFVLSTSLLSKPSINKFRESHANYFTNLFDAIREHPGAILGWLQSYTLHPEFKPNGDAPDTDSKHLMREASQDESFDGLEGFIGAAPAWDICDELLCIKSLTDAAMAGTFDDQPIEFELPAPNRLKPVLTQLGFHSMGRARPGSAGAQGKGSTMQRYWSKTPEAIRDAGGLKEFVRLRCPSDDIDDLGLD
jgi:hypothetical protein